jgi:hypothetical protein
MSPFLSVTVARQGGGLAFTNNEWSRIRDMHAKEISGKLALEDPHGQRNNLLRHQP